MTFFALNPINRVSAVLMAALCTIPLLKGCGDQTKSERDVEMNIFLNKPLFELTVKSFGASYGALVNGVYVQIQFDPEAKEEVTLPINHYFKSGENEIGMKVMPEETGEKFNPAAYVELTLTVREFGTNTAHPIFTLAFDGSHPPEIQTPKESITLSSDVPFNRADQGDIKITDIEASPMIDFPGGLTITQLVSIPSNLPRWKFFDSDNLPLPTELSEADWESARLELFNEYKNIYTALEKQDIASIASLFEERSREMDLAFYESAGTTQKQLLETLKDTAGDEELVLAPIEPEIVGFAYTESSKLRELARGDNGAAIAYSYKDGSGSRGFPIIFRRENGKWIITR